MFQGRRGLLVMLAGLSAFGMMSMDFYLPAFPQVAADLGVPVGSVQLTMSTCLIGLAVGQVLWGPTSDRYGRRAPLIAGLLLFISTSILIAFIHSFPVLVALRLLQGFGGSSGIVIGRAILRDLFSGTDLARAMSMLVSIVAITPVLAPIVGAGILLIAPWPTIFVVQAVFGAACLVGVLRFTDTLAPERRATHGFVGALRQYGALATNPRFLYGAVIAMFGTATIQAFISGSPVVFIEDFNTSQLVFSIIFGVSALMMTLTAQLNLRIFLRHFSPLTIIRAALVVQVITGLLAALAAFAGAGFWIYMIPVLMFNAGSAGTNSNGVAFTIEPFGYAAGTAAALVGAMQQTAAAVMAAALSIVTIQASIEMGLGVAVASSLGLIALAVGWRRYGPKPALTDA